MFHDTDRTNLRGSASRPGYTGADPGFLKWGGGIIGLLAKRGSRRGSNFGPNVKKPT